MRSDTRKLKDLEGVGKAALLDFKLLGVSSIEKLAKEDPENLFLRLTGISGPQDICVLDVFRCAVAQASNEKLPDELKKWWYWSKLRKEANG